MRTAFVAFWTVVLFSWTTQAQWLNYPTPGTPRLPDGKPDLAAPAPPLVAGRKAESGGAVSTCRCRPSRLVRHLVSRVRHLRAGLVFHAEFLLRSCQRPETRRRADATVGGEGAGAAPEP